MAYAEKRGRGPKSWRVRYKRPDGTKGSETGFETKKEALEWGREQEFEIASGQWIDPDAGKILVRAWVERWFPAQDVGLSTTENRDYLLRRFILPDWGHRELGSIGSEEINTWEKAIPDRYGVSQRTASDARGLLCTILGDAVTAKPPLLRYNPALRQRNRGRRTGRKLARSPQRAWVTPLQALLLAERAALLSGRDSDFTLLIAIGYTGMRWGESIGLERKFLLPGVIHVEWQLREIGGTFHRLPPKDDSYRSPDWEPCLPVDLPPFLNTLLARQAAATAGSRCSCVTIHEGSGQYLFTGPDGGHHRRSNYARRIFRPACDGHYSAAAGKPLRLIIADTTTWPGVPIAAWPAAPPVTAGQATVAWQPPRGRGIAVIADDTPLACWLPIKPGLTPHGLRHSHKTWMTEDGIPEILAEQRLGHEVPGMRGLYAHVSDTMRQDLTAKLQARWETSLMARAALHPHSPVPLLDELLAPYRPKPQPPRTRTPVRRRVPAPAPAARARKM
jgi:integrase